MGIRLNWPFLFLDDSVDPDTAVGANRGTRRAPYARILVGRIGEMIAPVVDLLAFQGQNSGGARHYAKIATFAPLLVDNYRS